MRRGGDLSLYGEALASSALLNHPCSDRQRLIRLWAQDQKQDWTHKDLELTHRAFGSDGHRLQEDLHDPGSDPRRVLAVGVQVVQDLLDHVVRVLRLSP